MTKLAALVKGKTQPGRRDDVRRLFEQHLAPRASSDDAQEIVIWCADSQDPDGFFLFELYRDAAAMQANATAPWFGEYMNKVGPLLAGMPEFAQAEPQWMVVKNARP